MVARLAAATGAVLATDAPELESDAEALIAEAQTLSTQAASPEFFD
jgi:hypothetical protein